MSFAFIFICICINTFSQKVYVAKVCDQETRRPLKDVTITVDTTKTTSNISGFFQIKGDTSKLLTAEFAGYEKLSFKFPETYRFVFYLQRTESETDQQKKKAFYKYLGENLRYPSEARNANIQGTSCIYFEVDTVGRIITTEHINRIAGGCSDEVLRQLKRAPQVWYSIKKNTKFQLRVVFKIYDSLFPVEYLDPKAPEGIILLPEMVVVARKISSVTHIR